MQTVLLYFIQIRRYDTLKIKNVIFQTSIFRKPLQIDIAGYDTSKILFEIGRAIQKYNNIQGVPFKISKLTSTSGS